MQLNMENATDLSLLNGQNHCAVTMQQHTYIQGLGAVS